MHLPSVLQNLRSTAPEFRKYSDLRDKCICATSKLKQNEMCPMCLTRVLLKSINDGIKKSSWSILKSVSENPFIWRGKPKVYCY